MARVFALIAGEASGDKLGAGLIKALRERYPDARFVGMGGKAMANAGCEIWRDCDELSVMGLIEVLRHLPRLLRLKKDLFRQIGKLRPDCVIGIDAPDFNLRLSRQLRELGLTTVQYVSPTVWAWREKRVTVIRRSVDKVLCLYPFEPDFFAGHGVQASFVGHPMADRLRINPDRSPAREALGLIGSDPVLALLPGSRSSEVARLGPVLANTAAELAQRHPGMRFVTACASEKTRRLFGNLLTEARSRDGQGRLAEGQVMFCSSAAHALSACDFGLAASGTVTLEAALLGRPVMVVYKVAALTHFLLRSMGMLKLERVALPNILLDEALIPEFLQDQARVDALVEQTARWLADPRQLSQIEQRFAGLHELLAKDADRSAAAAIAGLIEGQ